MNAFAYMIESMTRKEKPMRMTINQDLWEYLAASDKTIVLYGMGNGADKILAACAEKGIKVGDCFASDGFVRGHSFHGMPVRTWSEIKERYGADRVIVLLSFGTSRPEVLENIRRIAAETELYAPDVPAFGDGLFDRAFAEAHRADIEQVYALLADEESRRIYENVVRFKLTGRIEYLFSAESEPSAIMQALICPARLSSVADLGAYNGDTVRELLANANSIERIFAMEPDRRNFKKLEAYAAEETRAQVLPYRLAAWNLRETLTFDASGNRNASFGSNRSATLGERPMKRVEVEADTLDHVLGGASVDYIKYDVEGSERQALEGSHETIRRCRPTLAVSLYHRNEDLFALPLYIHRMFPQYQDFYMRRLSGIPAWDLTLYCK